MNKMSIRKDDLVVVLSGKDKGKQGKVLEVMPKEGKVVVEKVNLSWCVTASVISGANGFWLRSILNPPQRKLIEQKTE